MSVSKSIASVDTKFFLLTIRRFDSFYVQAPAGHLHFSFTFGEKGLDEILDKKTEYDICMRISNFVS
jgi:hypothetical protein